MNYFFCVLLLLAKNDTCKNKYLHELLKIPIQEDYLMVVSARHNSKTVKVLLTNLELTENLNRKTIKINEEINEKIRTNQHLFEADDSTRMIGTTKHYKEVNAIKAKGKKYFINYYFNEDGYLKSKDNEGHIGHIKEELFDWNVFMKEDHFEAIRLLKKDVCYQ